MGQDVGGGIGKLAGYLISSKPLAWLTNRPLPSLPSVDHGKFPATHTAVMALLVANLRAVIEAGDEDHGAFASCLFSYRARGVDLAWITG